MRARMGGSGNFIVPSRYRITERFLNFGAGFLQVTFDGQMYLCINVMVNGMTHFVLGINLNSK